MAKHTIRNDRTNESVETDHTPAELAARFADITGGAGWIWFHIAKTVMSHTAPDVRKLDALNFISAMFIMAVGRGLKKPMIRLGMKAEGRRYKLYLSARGTVCIKGGNVHPLTADPVGDEEYVGCLLRGKFLASDRRTMLPADTLFLSRLEADPAGFFASASKDMNRCCYCGLPLEDQRSKDAGYGETCATRWGLPWGTKSEQHIPSFADLYMRAGVGEKAGVQVCCANIRSNPTDALSWAMLADALRDAGWPDGRLPAMPEAGVIIPRE